MVFLSGRTAPNGKRREIRRSEKGARNKTTANLLIFHKTAKSTISQANNFQELQARRRSVFVSQAKFFSSQAKYFVSQAKFSLSGKQKNSYRVRISLPAPGSRQENKGVGEVVIASDSEATQTEPQNAQSKSRLLRFARNDG
jgi:hypothetical protein